MRDVAPLFLRWIFVRAIFHRGYWLVTSLYLVVEAELSPFQLVFIGTAQGLTAFAFEIPAGVLADTVSRKWAIVVAHALMGAGMVVTGLVTAFPPLVFSQMLWGLAWTFSSGADVAWLTDELDEPARVAGVLVAGARWEQLGAAAGLLGFGLLAWATDLGPAIVLSGAAMIALGVFVALRFPEHRFTPARENRWRASAAIFRRGLALARGDRQILVVFAATLLVNGAAEGYGRLLAKHLVDLGLPRAPDPIVWLTGLGLVSLVAGALALRVVEARIDGVGVARRVYVAACAIGAAGLVLFAVAPDAATAMAAAVLVGGIAWTVMRTVSVIWVNRRTAGDVRATVQSMLAQAEYLGEIVLGVTLGLVARASDIPFALLGAGALVVVAGVLVARVRAER